MPKVICFDFDHTIDIKSEPYPAIGEENHLMLNVLKTHIKNGDTLILNTMREDERLKEALDWLYARGIAPDAVNDNAEPQKEAWANNPRKIFCDVNYDDKNFNWDSAETRTKLAKFCEHGNDGTGCLSCSNWDGIGHSYCKKHGYYTRYFFWCRDWEKRALKTEAESETEPKAESERESNMKKKREIKDMQEELLKELSECEKPTGDETETYTSGYRNGYRNGRAQLIRYVLELPGDGVREGTKEITRV